MRGDHPRMRGEHLRIRCRRRRPRGSSPHARGALHPLLRDARRAGIIPACAGSTRLSGLPPRRRRDHPRMRGEHRKASESGASSPESSSHARGAQFRSPPRRARVGIIPACAGSTCGLPGCRASRRDHPRMRGEHAAGAWWEPQTKGSSQHARGALEAYGLVALAGGIIPACAGSTYRRWRSHGRARDHPRMRGEHTLPDTVAAPCSGSSPHARGTLWQG